MALGKEAHADLHLGGPLPLPSEAIWELLK
jgi:hypothetical protein